MAATARLVDPSWNVELTCWTKRKNDQSFSRHISHHITANFWVHANDGVFPYLCDSTFWSPALCSDPYRSVLKSFFCGMPCKPTEWMKRSRKSECEMKWSTPPPTIVKLVLLCLSNLYTSLQAPAPDHLLSEVQVEQIPLAPPLIDDWMLVVSLPVSPREMTNEMTTLSLHITAYYCISLHHCITWLTRTIQYDLSLAGQRDWSFTLRIHLSRAPKGKAQKQTISPICTWSLGIPLLGWFITPLKWLIVRDGFLWLQYYVMPQRQVMQTAHSPVAVNRFSPSQGTAL